MLLGFDQVSCAALTLSGYLKENNMTQVHPGEPMTVLRGPCSSHYGFNQDRNTTPRESLMSACNFTSPGCLLSSSKEVSLRGQLKPCRPTIVQRIDNYNSFCLSFLNQLMSISFSFIFNRSLLRFLFSFQ